MRIKWNRQLDGSLTNRQPDGSEMPNKDNSNGGTKSHNAPKIFRIFRRKKNRQLPPENSDIAPPCSQAPSEVDESDCASISSVATVASQPVTDVCHRDRTLSIFSSFRISLPGGKKKSKRNVPVIPSVPLFQAEEIQNNHYSSPDLRREKLDNSHVPTEFSKSSTSVEKTWGPFENVGDTQSLSELRVETSKSFALLKSDSTKHEPKLSKSVSFSDCQTKKNTLKGNNQSVVGELQFMNGYETKIKPPRTKQFDYSCEKSFSRCANNSNDAGGNALHFAIHPDPEGLHNNGLSTCIANTDSEPKIPTDNKECIINNFKPIAGINCDKEKKSETISEAKKKYFSRRDRKCNKFNHSNDANERKDLDFNFHGSTVYNSSERVPFPANNFGVNLKDYFPMCKKLDTSSECASVNNKLEVLGAVTDKCLTNNCNESKVDCVKNAIEKLPNGLIISDKSNDKISIPEIAIKDVFVADTSDKTALGNLLKCSDNTVLPKVNDVNEKFEILNSDLKCISSNIEAKVSLRQETVISNAPTIYSQFESPVANVIETSNSCDSNEIVNNSIFSQNICENKNAHSTHCNKINASTSTDMFCDTAYDISPKNGVSYEPILNNSFDQSFLETNYDIKTSIDNYLCSFKNLTLENYLLEDFSNAQCIGKQISCLHLSMPCIHFDNLNNSSFLYKLNNYQSQTNHRFSSILNGVGIWNAAFTHDLHRVGRIDSTCIENNISKKRCDAPLTINENSSAVPHCKTSDFDKVSDTCAEDGHDFSTREKNEERCPSYYSMSVRPAGLPTTGVTVAGSDLLEEISDTPQFIENKGGSISTEINIGTIQTPECCPLTGHSPTMLSSIDMPSASLEKDLRSDIVTKNVDERELRNEEAKEIFNANECNLYLPAGVSVGNCTDSISNCVSAVSAPNVGIEISIEDTRQFQNNINIVTTPVISEYSDYFSMHDENCSVDDNFVTKESDITLNQDCENSEMTLTPIDSATFSISASSSPDSLEIDESPFSNFNKSDSETFVTREETTSNETCFEEESAEIVAKVTQRQIRTPKINFQDKNVTQRSQKKNLSEGISLIPSLRKNGVNVHDKRSSHCVNKKSEKVRRVENLKGNCEMQTKSVEQCSKPIADNSTTSKIEKPIINGFPSMPTENRPVNKLSKHKSEESLPLPVVHTHENGISRRCSTSDAKQPANNCEPSFQTCLKTDGVDLQNVSNSKNLDIVANKNDSLTSDILDNSDYFLVAPSDRSSNATLDEISLSEAYSAPLDQIVNLRGQQECGLQTRSSSMPAVVGQVQLPSPLKELVNYKQVDCPITDKDVAGRKSRIPRKQTGVRGALHSTKPVRPPMWLSKAELTQEIQRLGTLCEARTKELNRLKMETKHVSVGFDAFAALFKYMVEDLDGLSVPVLTNDLQKTLKQLELAKQDLAYYEREVEEMKAHHSQELNDLSNKLFEVYQGEITELSSKHQEELNQLNYGHQQQIENLSTTLRASSDEAQTKHELLISELQQELITQREELQLFQEREIKDLEVKHTQATKTLKEHIEQLEKKCAELNQHSASMENAMRNDTDSKLQWITARKIDLEKEVESLKTVLEMKNKELHTLRVQTLEMEKQLEELPLAREKIKMLQARAEDLEALMKEKTKLERKLSTENHVIKDTYEKESKVNKRLSMENEELQWRLRQAENTLLSGSFSEVSEYPEDVENGIISPVKTPPAPQMSRSVFFTFVDKDDATQSPRSQYKKITPGFLTNYKTSPGKTLKSPSGPSPRRAKSHSEPPQPPLSCTPKKILKQKSTPKRPRSGSECGRATNEHSEVTTYYSVTGSMASSISSESSVFEHKEQLLEEHEEQIMETLQILREQRSVESPTDESVKDTAREKEWCSEDIKVEIISPDFETGDMSRSSEFSDPKTYYHMTFPVPKEAGIVDCDTEDNGKNTSEGTTPSLEDPAETIHSILESDIPNETVNSSQIQNHSSQDCLNDADNSTRETESNASNKPAVSIDGTQSTESVQHSEAQDQR